MNRSHASCIVVLASFLTASQSLAAEGNTSRGQRLFGACAACHSLQADENLTGPSLAGLWNRKAGSLPSFTRYSPALKSANIVWNDKTLDEWINDTQHLVPGNEMTFVGMKDARQRADLLAFLKEATQPGASVAQGVPVLRLKLTLHWPNFPGNGSLHCLLGRIHFSSPAATRS